MRDYGFPLLHSEVAKTAAEAQHIAKKIGKPVVLKIVSQNILHKTDAGGVILNVEPVEAGTKFTEMIKISNTNFRWPK